jgi:hypothetical protein
MLAPHLFVPDRTFAKLAVSALGSICVPDDNKHIAPLIFTSYSLKGAVRMTFTRKSRKMESTSDAPRSW